MVNKPCPECRKNGGHDSKGDHLFLMQDGVTWGCFHKDYHETGSNYFEKGGVISAFPSQRDLSSSSARETINDILTFPLLNSSYRCIRAETFHYFQARVSFSEDTGQMESIYFPIHSKGELIGFHRRNLESKTFSNIGNIAGKDLDLFGIDKCAKTGRNIVITEGHFDALSVYQIIKDKYPKINPNIVSVNNGLGSIKDIVSSVNSLNAYESILLSFDMDQPGRDGVAKVAKLLGSKIKVMELSCKDANEALTKGKDHEVINAIFNPREYIPSDVLKLEDIYDEILKETPYGLPYPWEGLTEETNGLFENEIIAIGAAPGGGKTIFMNQLSAFLIKEYKKKIALFSLEETPSYTAKKLLGSLIKKKLHAPGTKVDPEEIKQVYEELKEYLYIYNAQGFLSWEDIKSNIRYLASLGVKFFVIDPITAVTAMCSSAEANELLNGMMAELSGLTQSLGITVILVCHLNNPKTGKMHSEGGRVLPEHFTGSRAIYRWSHLMLGLERNQLSEDQAEKNTLIVRVIKLRASGSTGGVIPLNYNQETGRLEEADDDCEYGV